jgi:hypothetical protein
MIRYILTLFYKIQAKQKYSKPFILTTPKTPTFGPNFISIVILCGSLEMSKCIYPKPLEGLIASKLLKCEPQIVSQRMVILF